MHTLGQMVSFADEGSRALRQLLLVAALIALGYVCIRTLRFTSDGLNVAFVCAFLLIPFLAIRPVLRFRRWAKVLTTVLLAPFWALSLFLLLFTATCDIPAVVTHRELSRELGGVRQGHYSVHLVWQETAGGAVGPHGVGLEQRMFIVPGLYAVRHLDYSREYAKVALQRMAQTKLGCISPRVTCIRRLTEFTRSSLECTFDRRKTGLGC